LVRPASSSAKLRGADRCEREVLHITTSVDDLARCDHMLLYLTGKTWTRGAESAALGDELSKAMGLGVHILLAHEMSGGGGQTERFGCEFGVNFACADGTTPDELLRRNLCSEIAVPLKGGPWREASMALLSMALSMDKDDVVSAEEGGGTCMLSANVADNARMKRMLRQTTMADTAGAGSPPGI
jgi:hypothetical protein